MTQHALLRRSRPRVLDACCGAGGAAVGYHRAGFDVLGVDIAPQPNYPFPFVQADAVEFVREHGADFDFIHSSWPCQHHSTLTKGTNKGREYPDLIPAGRAAMESTGRPWAIENVMPAPIRRDVVLCGEMFGLGVTRHRKFETSGWSFTPPVHLPHRGRTRGYRHGRYYDGPYYPVYGDGGGKGTVPEWQAAMGIDWTDVRKEIAEAIPPAYTHWIATQYLSHEKRAAA
ncbi:DNA cytosine methyltransferase [Streptomyces netropsis]|uniref:DNA (Cytosine-5)-methyltransferase 1 n=1 Tax=Streptomyces netropsis TaxID=55404 RepID=A0A7W7PDV5_STRNE|nr:DNA cytosine methyltransferase [Streptomyces netropsis]MBB4885005.1 DNA (cytosine-5)-methyltransferase 1 [Streptomyces netropsis]